MLSTDLYQIRDETFIEHAELHEELASTNDRALEIAETVSKPALIVANRQNSGRGRGGNTWWSNEEALTFSLVLDGNVIPNQQRPWSLVSLSIGVAICDAVHAVCPGIDIGLKWPNDVFVCSRTESMKKVAGILIECPSQRSSNLIVGIGINVNNPRIAAPVELRDKATSLLDACGERIETHLMLRETLLAIENVLTQLAQDAAWIHGRWKEMCVLTGRLVEIETGNETQQGICRGINKDGAAVLETPGGTKAIISGTVKSIQ